MTTEILDCLRRKRDICIKNMIPGQNTAFTWTLTLTTIGPHSLKEHTEINKIKKSGVNRPDSKQDTANGKWLYLAYYWVYLHQIWGFCKSQCALSDYWD